MEPIEFKEQTDIIAKDQPQYINLPVRHLGGYEGRTVFCWKASFRDRLRILLTGIIWHEVLTFNRVLQPQKLSTDKPDMDSLD